MTSPVEQHPHGEPGSVRTLLAGDNPQSYIPGDRRRALARGEDLPARAQGSAVFIDISGFTPLTEALAAELGARRGAEELSETLETVFAALLESLHLWRGSVVYFSGDAVTAWLDGDDGSRAVACAQQVQRTMDVVGRVRSPGGREVTLGVKVAVAVGQVSRFVVGDPAIQRIDVLAGRLMDSLADAEQQSVAGEVVLDAGARASLGDRVLLSATRSGRSGPVGVLAEVVRPAAPLGPVPAWPDLPDEVVREWLLPPVWERLAAGRGEFLAELRPAVPMFVRFGGLDFEDDPAAPAVLDQFVRLTQRVLDEQGGHVLQLTIGDKGAYLYAVLGSPTAHEDDAARACEAALRLHEAAGSVAVTGVTVGLAAGRLRSGTYGHWQRRTFCCLGDATNLAARLMSKAPGGEVWVHGDVADATRGAFTWRDMAPLSVKGKAAPVSVRALTGRATRPASSVRGARTGRLVGREDVLAQLRGLWGTTVSAGRGRVAVVAAEAGAGKSRLVAELVDGLHADGVRVAAGGGSPTASRSAYAAWRGVWSDLLALGSTTDPTPDAVQDAVARLEPGLVDRAPLLGPVLGAALPETRLTASFDSELRKTSTEDLLGRLLTVRAGLEPLCLVLEDCHWLDPLSQDLLATLGRVAAALPVLVVLTTRELGDPAAGLPLPASLPRTTVALPALAVEAAGELARDRFAGHGADPAPQVLETVVTRSEGNPFYLEQLVDYVATRPGAGDGTLSDPDALELPSSLHSLVLSRIDAQGEGPRRAVKVASVVGREFASPLVADAYPDLGGRDVVHRDLVAVARTRLVDLEDPDLRRFSFGHAVTRDVAYDSLPHAIRTVLHARVGDTLEAEPEGPTRHLDLLAFHYARSEDPAKARRYLLTAAEAAGRQYANSTAAEHLRAALPFLQGPERADVLLRLAVALELDGAWADAESVVAQARTAARESGDDVADARAVTAQAELHRKQGRFAEAAAALDEAEAAFTAVGEEAGLGRVLHLRGTVASQQGDVAAARAAYEASLTLRRRLGDEPGQAAMLTNLGLVAEDEGDLEAAERLGREGLALRRALHDARGVSISLTNLGLLQQVLGRLDRSRDLFEEALVTAEEVGEPWMVALSRHNLGNVLRDLGDLEAAAPLLEYALEAYAERDDLWTLAHVLEDVALWLLAGTERLLADPQQENPASADHVHRDAWAVRLLDGARGIRDHIGAPRLVGTQEAIDAASAPLLRRGAPGSDETPHGGGPGRDDSVDALVQLARRVLGDVGPPNFESSS